MISRYAVPWKKALDPLLTTAGLAERKDFVLGEAVVSPSTRTIRGPGGSIVVEPRVMQVLVLLAEAAGGVVTREALLRRCWGGVYVGDDSLNRAVAGVRRVAAGVGAGSFAIETIPRTGYRLAAPPAVPGDGARVAGMEASAAAAPPVPRAVTRRVALAAAAAGVGAAFFLGLHRFGAADSPPSPAAELRARALDALRYMMPERDAEAVGLLGEAVRLEPRDAAAWGMLALAYQRIAASGAPSGSAAATQRAVAAARRALELDPGSSDAQAALALLRPTYRDWFEAEARFRRLLARNPDQAAVVGALARLLFEVGRVRDSVAAMARAMRLDPLSPSNYWRRMFGLWSVGDLIEAERVIDRGAELFPRQPDIWFARFWLLAATGRGEEALAMEADGATRPLGVPQREFDRLALAARAFRTRAPADVGAVLATYESAARENATGAEVGMLLASDFGALDRAYALAGAYFFDRGFSVPSERLTQGSFSPRSRRNAAILFWPPAARMRADARFGALTREIGLDDYWRRANVSPDFRRAAGS
jgi:DNA-binding winged helix-turn-helix (wHTH) protein/tetratricopeptide (TPR) repeat protein